MIKVTRPLRNEELFFVSEDEHEFFAFFYPLTDEPALRIWAVSGSYKPLAANVMDFDSYDDALAYIETHSPSKMKWFN